MIESFSQANCCGLQMLIEIEIKQMMRKIIETSGNRLHNRFVKLDLKQPRHLHWQLHISVIVLGPATAHIRTGTKKAWEFTFAYPVIRPWRAYQKDKQRSQPTPG